MLAPDGGPSDPLEIPADAQLERLQRRVAALERQLEARIAQVDDLRRQLDERAAPAGAAREDAARVRAEADVLRHKAEQYDALMRTFTMRALGGPRAWYASARRRLARP